MANMAFRTRLTAQQTSVLRRGVLRTGVFVGGFVAFVAAATQLG